MQKLDRGVTVLRAEGGYSGQERPVLLCVPERAGDGTAQGHRAGGG